MYSSGTRVSELINLQLSDIFLEEDYIKIMGKGNKERLVPIGGKAKKKLIHYIQKTRTNFNKISSKGYVFLSYRSKQLTRMAVFNIIKKYTTLSGISKKVSPHTFRHSFATHLIEGGANLRAIQEMLGHKSITTTEIYTHLDKDYLRSNIIQFHPRSK